MCLTNTAVTKLFHFQHKTVITLGDPVFYILRYISYLIFVCSPVKPVSSKAQQEMEGPKPLAITHRSWLCLGTLLAFLENHAAFKDFSEAC